MEGQVVRNFVSIHLANNVRPTHHLVHHTRDNVTAIDIVLKVFSVCHSHIRLYHWQKCLIELQLMIGKIIRRHSNSKVFCFFGNVYFVE